MKPGTRKNTRRIPPFEEDVTEIVEETEIVRVREVIQLPQAPDAVGTDDIEIAEVRELPLPRTTDE